MGMETLCKISNIIRVVKEQEVFLPTFQRKKNSQLDGRQALTATS